MVRLRDLGNRRRNTREERLKELMQMQREKEVGNKERKKKENIGKLGNKQNNIYNWEMDRILKAQLFFHVYFSDCVRTLKADILVRKSY